LCFGSEPAQGLDDSLIVGGDDHLLDALAHSQAIHNMLDERPAGARGEHLAGKSRGSITSGNDDSRSQPAKRR
jgi:hypothetical protein